MELSPAAADIRGQASGQVEVWFSLWQFSHRIPLRKPGVKEVTGAAKLLGSDFLVSLAAT